MGSSPSEAIRPTLPSNCMPFFNVTTSARVPAGSANEMARIRVVGTHRSMASFLESGGLSLAEFADRQPPDLAQGELDFVIVPRGW